MMLCFCFRAAIAVAKLSCIWTLLLLAMWTSVLDSQLSSGRRESCPVKIDGYSEDDTLLLGASYDPTIFAWSLPSSATASRPKRQLQDGKLPFDCGYTVNFTAMAVGIRPPYLKNGTCTDKMCMSGLFVCKPVLRTATVISVDPITCARTVLHMPVVTDCKCGKSDS